MSELKDNAILRLMGRNRERRRTTRELIQLFWNIRETGKSCTLTNISCGVRTLSDREISEIIDALVTSRNQLDKDYQEYEKLKKEMEDEV